MHPALSVISFTTLLGAAQGFVVGIAFLCLLGEPPLGLVGMLEFSVVLLVTSLGLSFLHLGRPERAWRAASMWRTSWLSREVIVLPLFIGSTGCWALAERLGFWIPMLPLLCVALSALLWYCTAMIYACLTFIREWANPLTIVNYFALGLASGFTLLTAALWVTGNADQLVVKVAVLSIAINALGMTSKLKALTHNASLRSASTVQSATGIREEPVRQISMGMSAGAFNTREFFHGKTPTFLRHIRQVMVVAAFVSPILLLCLSLFYLNQWLSLVVVVS